MNKEPFLKTDADVEAAKQIVDYMSRTDLSNKEKIHLMQKVNNELTEKEQMMKAQHARLSDDKKVILSMVQWSERPFVIERNDCSRLHLLREAGRKGNLASRLNNKLERFSLNPDGWINSPTLQTFVVQHDWSSALGALEDGEVSIPYDRAAFEFRISGKTVIAIVFKDELDGDKLKMMLHYECDQYWLLQNSDTTVEDDRKDPIIAARIAIFDQIRAICVAMDAEIATHHVQRAPSALNKKRAEKGKVPLSDYHVVNLAKRHRIANPSKGEGEHGKVRLHFRRGHWRHYETTKTWIKWCLVGNPDLGFINKHYQL